MTTFPGRNFIIVGDRVRKVSGFLREAIHMFVKKQILEDRRKSRRVDFHVNASGKGEQWSFSGEILNINNTGAYFATNGYFTINESIDLTLFFQHGDATLEVCVPCRVVRVDGHGVGVTSRHIDVVNLMNLKNMLELYSSNPKQLFEESCRFI